MKNLSFSGKKVSYFISLLSGGLLALFLTFWLSMTAHAADMGAVTVSPSNNGLGVVSCTRNGTPFTNYTYAAATDYITVTALPLNKEYNFLHWTDNGVIVSNSSTYSFSAGTKNHLVIAHFGQKDEFKGERYDSDKNRSSLTRNTPACDYASGYKIDGMALNTTLVTIDDATRSAVETLTGGSFIGAFRITFTFGYNGKAKETIDHKVRLVLQLPAKQAGTCYVTAVGDHAPIVLDDLDEQQLTVTFETDKSDIYVLTAVETTAAVTLPALITPATEPALADPSAMPASNQTAPLPSTAPASVPAVTAPTTDPASSLPSITAPAAPVTEAQYQESVINILRYQLQQAGITPAA